MINVGVRRELVYLKSTRRFQCDKGGLQDGWAQFMLFQGGEARADALWGRAHVLVLPSLLVPLSVLVWCRCGICVLILPFNSLLKSPLKETSSHCRGNMASCWKLLLEILWVMIRNLKDTAIQHFQTHFKAPHYRGKH